jgi:protein ImuB
LRRLDAPPDRPSQAVGEDNRVAAVNRLAADAGIRPGMRRREAEAKCPTIVTLLRDPGAEAAAFEPVAAAVESVVPRIELADPGLMFVPVAGAVRFYGGEFPLVERVGKEIEKVAGPGAHLGLAAGPFAARCAAEIAIVAPHIVEDDAAFLSSLDVSEVASEDLVSTFRWLGITTLGDLSRLPRGAILSRFGTPGLEAHRVASGQDRETMPRRLAPGRSAEERFNPPITEMEQAGFVARSLANRLIEVTAVDGGVPHRVEVEAEAASGITRTRTWRSGDPFDASSLAERVWWQLRAWVESEGIPGGLIRLRLEPADISDEGRQLALAEDAASIAEAERSLARVQTLVGLEGVLRARPQGGRDPAEQVQWYRWGEEAPAPRHDPEAPWPGRTPQPSPALVPSEPRRLDVEWDEGFPTRLRLGSRWEPVLSWAGPWRRLGRWWEGEEAADRYQIVTSAGAFLCEVRGGESYLVGVYD